MNGSGGWPLTVLLTPDQKPFWAGTYLPKTQLLALLEQVTELWQYDRGRLLSMGSELTEHLRREEEIRPDDPTRELVEAGVQSFARMFDAKWGGFGRAPKFPTAHNLVFLLRYGGLTGDDHALDRWTVVPDINRPGFELCGFNRITEPRRIVVIGNKEIEFIATMTEQQQRERYPMLTDGLTPAIIITKNNELPPVLKEIAEATNFPILRTSATYAKPYHNHGNQQPAEGK